MSIKIKENLATQSECNIISKYKQVRVPLQSSRLGLKVAHGSSIEKSTKSAMFQFGVLQLSFTRNIVIML